FSCAASVFRQHVPIPHLQVLRLHESHFGSLCVGPENPRNFFHLVNAWMVAIEIARAGRHWKRDRAVLEYHALDDFVSQASALYDSGAAASVAEGRLRIFCGSSLNFD